MDMTKNRFPDQVRHIHLIAICGTAMGALACMLKEKGYHVTGSDHKVYPPMSDFLKNQGIEIREGFDPLNLDHSPDLVVVGNAVSCDNPEVEAMLKAGYFFCSMPQAVNHFFAQGKKTVVVAGTHGKTTTSSLMAWVLFCAGLDPSYLIGGIVNNFKSNFRIGTGPFMVLEGDEYDTAFFDKGAKFMHYVPDYSVLTSVEFDHADIFRDLDHVKTVFGHYVGLHRNTSVLMAWDSDANIDELIVKTSARVERYGTRAESDWKMENVMITPPWMSFDVYKQGQRFGTFKSPMPGMHNLLNSLSVIAVADHLDIPVHTLQDALMSFKGVKRRQEVRGEKRGVTVMDDFAHHPTAVRETIRALKPFYPDGRLIAVFEPRTNSSMRDVFQKKYPESFDGADMVCIRKPPLLSKIPENHRFSSEKLVADLKAKKIDAHYFDETEGIISFVADRAKSGDLVLIMSNGGFDNIHDRLLKAL
ncbi:MAG: UDP-N-acetylmuramate:L-alanyl-gamma-D-glutamyl-meso-diaminopimelate ligase [Proteobacteria bacterium]|nr:UDP-N-acetylmuramate:L-alanyl-gamma-D-glutamyl-meso-diaminopimelate ligase [Pseudomonadota bacterium]